MMRPPGVGDRVETGDGLRGRLVVDIDAGEAVDGFDAAEWAYLGAGLVVETDEIGLVRYVDRAGIATVDRG